MFYPLIFFLLLLLFKYVYSLKKVFFMVLVLLNYHNPVPKLQKGQKKYNRSTDNNYNSYLN